MFTEMISLIKKGQFPLPHDLRPRFKAGLIKKMGVLQQPPPCRTGDQKINPASQHLFWAALLLEDQEGLIMIEGVIVTEQETTEINAWKMAAVEELLKLAPNKLFRQQLEEKINRLLF
ncbi:MAG: hypothetical protein KKB30_07825 [Proteobacteria bacterium]|nr:hypothetical protein [Pseudomonadota bacterium]MBU1716025.1 hypothetical protein [Pseudomonadota bacterium]